MNAVIVELRGKYAAALGDDGTIVKIKNQQYVIGQVIEIQSRNKHAFYKFTAWAACLTIFLLSGSVSAYACLSPYSYVSLDGYASVEYTLNRFDRVLQVNTVSDGLGGDAATLDLRSLKFKKIEEALAVTVQELAKINLPDSDPTRDSSSDSGSAPNIDSESEASNDPNSASGSDLQKEAASGAPGAPKDSPGIMVITASAPNNAKAEVLVANLQKNAQKNAEKNGKKVIFESLKASREQVREAHQMGVTVGKMNLVKRLQESAEQPGKIETKEWLQKPVQDILAEIKNNQSDHSGRKHQGASAREKKAGDRHERDNKTRDDDARVNQSRDNDARDNKSKDDLARDNKENGKNLGDNNKDKYSRDSNPWDNHSRANNPWKNNSGDNDFWKNNTRDHNPWKINTRDHNSWGNFELKVHKRS